MKRRIQLLLHTTGVFSYYYGYQYFIRAVELAAQDPEKLQSIRKEIYITIAFEFKTSITGVERDLRTVRDIMMRNGGGQLLARMTGNPAWSCKPPYPRDLIAIFSQYLRESNSCREPEILWESNTCQEPEILWQ